MACHDHTNTEWSHTSALSILLEKFGGLFAKHERGDFILIFRVINLNIFSCFQQDGLKVRTDSGVSHTHVLGDGFDFMDRSFVNEWGAQFFFTGDDTSILGFDTQTSFSVTNSGQGISNLSEFS